MAVLDSTAMAAALKELYDGQAVEDLVYKDNPFLALLTKNTDFEGKNKPIPIQIGVSQGRSAVFATAQANQTANVYKAFALTRVKDYSIASIDFETMLASQSDKGAFLKGAKAVVDGAFRSATNSLASALFRSGTGSIGQITTISTGVITLTDPNSVVQFEVNMVLQANATDGGTPRAAKGYVIAVDRSAGTVTVSATSGGAAGTPSGWTANDFLLQDGDVNAKVSGLAAWIPATAPSSTAFFGVDRSTDVTRLGGVRYDGSAQSIEEALIDASNLLAREGGKPDYCIMSFSSYSALVKALGAKVQYVDVQGPGKIGFKGVQITGANTTITCVPDRNCPQRTAYLLTMDTWSLETLGDAPQMLDFDGMGILRVYNADQGEVRVGYYGNLACNAPGWNAVVTLGQ